MKILLLRPYTVNLAIYRIMSCIFQREKVVKFKNNNVKNILKSNACRNAIDIISCFFLAGSMIAQLLDFGDGKFGGKCELW